MFEKRKCIVFVLFVMVFTTFIPTQDVWACSCGRSSSIFEYYDRADSVFIGTVTRIEPSTNFEGRWATELTTFEVNSKWKGNLVRV